MWELSENLILTLEEKYPNRLIYDEKVLEYLNRYEEIRNTLPKIIGVIFSCHSPQAQP